jgi:Arc/MetJ-type ribon-helix-helix transcriptional regulator
MTIHLGPEAERLISRKLSEGYASAEEVVLAGLRAMEQGGGDFAPGELDALIEEGERGLRESGPIPFDQVLTELRDRSVRLRATPK